MQRKAWQRHVAGDCRDIQPTETQPEPTRMFGPDSRLVAVRETSFKPRVATAVDQQASKCNLGSIGLQFG